jgi:hypothetical protein
MENQTKYIKFIDNLHSNWPLFVAKRKDLLIQKERFGSVPEKISENILHALFTEVLDWDIKDVNYQVGYADMEITKLGIKRIVIEAKRPGGISWTESHIAKHIEQALRYAFTQKVNTIAISDGNKLYVLNVDGGSITPRIFIHLDAEEPHEDLYYISVNGVDKNKNINIDFKDNKKENLIKDLEQEINDELLNPQYKLPSWCFAYVGDPNKSTTWKLPYLLLDGSVNIKRLPSAVCCVVTNHRGVQVKGIPEKDIPNVILKLAKAAKSVGKLDPENPKMANCYRQLYNAIVQFGYLDKI